MSGRDHIAQQITDWAAEYVDGEHSGWIIDAVLAIVQASDPVLRASNTDVTQEGCGNPAESHADATEPTSTHWDTTAGSPAAESI